jgi:hypothetical protein
MSERARDARFATGVHELPKLAEGRVYVEVEPVETLMLKQPMRRTFGAKRCSDCGHVCFQGLGCVQCFPPIVYWHGVTAKPKASLVGSVVVWIVCGVFIAWSISTVVSIASEVRQEPKPTQAQ